MFKKLKEKITEEVKAAPRNLFQPSLQQSIQVMTPQATPNESFSSDHNDSISDTSKNFEYSTTPEPSGFTSIDLRTPEVSRKSSLIFPVYESPSSYLQSDLESASEFEGSLCSSQRLGHITKESLYSSYQQVHSKYQKYKGRYVEIAKAYKKLETVMSESQDIMLRKNAELKEQCQLEQKAKAHLEEILRNDLEEKDHIINTLNTKINLLKDSEESIATVESGFDERSKVKTEEDTLINLNDDRVSPKNSKSDQEEGKPESEVKQVLTVELKAMEKKISEQQVHIHQLEETLQALKLKDSSLTSQLTALKNEVSEKDSEVRQLREETETKKVTLAETKMNFHRELGSKDILMADLRAQISQLNVEKSALENQMTNMEADGQEKANVSLKKLQAMDLLKQELQRKLESEASLEKSLELKNEESLQLKNKVDELEKALELKSLECLEMKHKMEELERTLETLKTSNDEMIRNLESELCTTPSVDQCVEQELNQLRQKMKDLEESSELEVRELRNIHEKDIENEKSKYNELIKQIENSLKSKENEIVQTLEEKDQIIYKLKNKLQSLNSDKSKMEVALKKQTADLQKKLELIDENLKVKQVTEQLENDDLKKIIVDLKNNVGELEIDKKYNETQQAELIKKIEYYKTMLNEKSDEFKAQKNLEHQFNVKIDSLEVNNEKLKNNINMLRKECDEKLRKEKEQHENIKKTLNHKLESEMKLMQELESMKTIIQEQEDRVPKSKITRIEDNYNKEIGELKHLVKKLGDDLEKCRNDIKIGISEKQELTKLVDSKEKDISSLQCSKNETEKMYINVKEELGKLQLENEKLSKEIILLQENLTQVSNEISSFRENESSSKIALEKINTITNENSALISQKEKIQQEMEEASALHRQQLYEIKDELSKCKVENVELSLNIKEEVAKLDVLNKEKSDLLAEQERHNKVIASMKADIKVKTSSEEKSNDLLNEVNKYREVNADLSLKSIELKEKIDVLTKEKCEWQLENDQLKKFVTTLQEENQISKQENNSSQILELQYELRKCKALNVELESYNEKCRTGLEKLGSYLKIPLKQPNTSPYQSELDMNQVIDRFKSLQTQIKNKEKNETDFFMLTLEEELKKERLLNKTLKKELKVEKEKQFKTTELNKIQERSSNVNMKQIQTYCNQMKSEVKQLKSFSMEQLDDFTKEFIKMKMDLIQGVIKFKHENNNLARTDTNNSPEELKKILNEEHTKKIKQLVSDFKQELISKEEEIRSLEDKQFDRRDAEELYISNELKRSIMNLEEENQSLGNSLEDLQLQIKRMRTSHSEEVLRLNAHHSEELKQLETKWREWMSVKLNDTEEKLREECDALSQEWQVERKIISEVSVTPHYDNNEELESRLEVDTDVHKDLMKLKLELNQVKQQHKDEVKELRRLLKLGKSGEDSTSECEGDGGKENAKLGHCLELEYLRNVLYEYMMGKEPLILARVLAAIVNFDPEHTAKILHREEQKVSVLGHMKFT